MAGYQFCILTLEEKIAKQKDLPEDVLPGGTAWSAKGFSYYIFLISLSLMLLSILPKAPSLCQFVVFALHEFLTQDGDSCFILQKGSLPLLSICS